MTYKLYQHQEETADFLLTHRLAFDMSDPGVGKTLASLTAYDRRPLPKGRLLAVAPKTILEPSWGQDIQNFMPHLKYSIAAAPKRRAAFNAQTDIVLINHDGVKWLAANQDVLEHFDTLVIDEFTAFKHRTSQRSKAILAIRDHFRYRIGLSGTPNSNTVCDLWHPALIIDSGERLGTLFFHFRAACCAPQQVGPQPNMVVWKDKNGAEETVADLLRDITIRHKFENCISIPENVTRTVEVEMPKAIMDQYRLLEEEAIIILEEGIMSVLHAGAKVKKLLQLVSGAVYDEDKVSHIIHTERYELVMDLVAARDHSIVAFNWKHQRDELARIATKQNISYAIIDGDTNDKDKPGIIRSYQAGDLQTLFCHPQSASHGLTLTRGCRTIWASPTYNAEWFKQFGHRIYRAGQKRKTETILIAARDTWETMVYEKLIAKLSKMSNLLDILCKTKERP